MPTTPVMIPHGKVTTSPDGITPFQNDDPDKGYVVVDGVLSFHSALAEEGGAGIRMRIAGRDLTARRLPAAPLMRLTLKLAELERFDADNSSIVPDVGGLFDELFEGDEAARWQETMEIISLPDAMNVLQTIITESSGRPTPLPSPSSPSP